MISALGRAGWLIDPQDLIYVIGGWSYGHFTNSDRVFAMHGPAVGAGIERQVARSWTVKAEYRYTHFLAKDVPSRDSRVKITTAGTTNAKLYRRLQRDRSHRGQHAHREARHVALFRQPLTNQSTAAGRYAGSSLRPSPTRVPEIRRSTTFT